MKKKRNINDKISKYSENVSLIKDGYDVQNLVNDLIQSLVKKNEPKPSIVKSVLPKIDSLLRSPLNVNDYAIIYYKSNSLNIFHLGDIKYEVKYDPIPENSFPTLLRVIKIDEKSSKKFLITLDTSDFK